MTDLASWLYAVVPADSAPPLADLTGVAGEPLRLLAEAPIGAVVGSVPRRWLERDPTGAPTDELAQLVRAHHRVVAALLPHAPVVPLRLGTVFSDDDRVRQLLRQRTDHLTAALARVRGRAEWGLRIYQAAPEPNPTTPEPVEAVVAGRPGTAYLLRRRQERIRQQQARAAALAQVQQIEQTLAPLAVAVAHPKSTGAGDDDKARLIRNSTYLVDNHRVAEFRTAVQQCAEANPGLRLRLTGPWPAYSFIPEESP